jgi:hypothetical protein
MTDKKQATEVFEQLTKGVNLYAKHSILDHETIPCGIKSKVIPDKWKANDPKAIKNWMEKLPAVRDWNNVIENDKKWELIFSLKNCKK